MRRASIVAVSLDRQLRDATEIFNSFQDYVREHGLSWDVIPLNYEFESTLVQLASSGKLLAAIGPFISDTWLSGLIDDGLHAINLLPISHIHSVTSINLDQIDLGVQAAQHLYQNGARHFVYFGSNRLYSNQLQFAGFSSCRFSEPVEHLSHLNDLVSRCQKCSNIRGLVGILCESDRHARLAIHQLKQVSWRCGQDYLILGSGNDPTQSALAGLGISSFRLPTHALGYAAATALHQRIQSGVYPEGVQNLRAELMPNESSLSTGRSGLAQKALSRLYAQVSNSQFEVTEFARGLGISRRSLEQAFKNELGTSPYKTLGELRFEHAKQLLAQSRLPVREIAQRCGCSEAAHFSSWFKKRAGQSPQKYRSIEVSN